MVDTREIRRVSDDVDCVEDVHVGKVPDLAGEIRGDGKEAGVFLGSGDRSDFVFVFSSREERTTDGAASLEEGRGVDLGGGDRVEKGRGTGEIRREWDIRRVVVRRG